MLKDNISWTLNHWYTTEYEHEDPLTFQVIEFTDDKQMRIKLCDESEQKFNDTNYINVVHHGEKSPC